MTADAILLLVLVAFVVWLGLNWQPLGKNKGCKHFPHLIRSLMIGMENSSALEFQHRDSSIHFSIRRHSGSDEEALLVLTIPRALWSEKNSLQIRERFESNNFDYQEVEADADKLGIVYIPVPDIWSDSSGSRGAHACRLFLESLDIPADARFDVRQSGLASRRIAERFKN